MPRKKRGYSLEYYTNSFSERITAEVTQHNQHDCHGNPYEDKAQARLAGVNVVQDIDMDKVTGIIGPDAVVKLTAVKLFANLFFVKAPSFEAREAHWY